MIKKTLSLCCFRSLSTAAYHVPQRLLSLNHGTIMTGRKKYSEEKEISVKKGTE